MPFPLCPPPSRVENKSHNNERRLEQECEEKSTETESRKVSEGGNQFNFTISALYLCTET